MAHKLRTLFKTSKAEKLPASIPLNPAVALREALINNHESFKRTHSDIDKAMDTWRRGEETLQFLLKPYVLGGRKQRGIPQTDGLRSGVTGFLNGMVTKDCGASEPLRKAAENLSTAPIFIMKSPDGTKTKFTLLNFATPGEHGIGKIDALDLPEDQRAQVAQRLKLALTELNNLGHAYVRNGPVPALLMDRANCVVLTSPGPANLQRRPAGRYSEDRRPNRRPAQENRPPSGASQTATQAEAASTSTMSQERLAALAGTYLSAEELQEIFDDPTKLASWADVINQLASQHTQSHEAQAAASTPASASASGDTSSLDLFDKARKYLSPEELDPIVRGEANLLDYLHIIDQRIEDGVVGGNYDTPPAYQK